MSILTTKQPNRGDSEQIHRRSINVRKIRVNPGQALKLEQRLRCERKRPETNLARLLQPKPNILKKLNPLRHILLFLQPGHNVFPQIQHPLHVRPY